MEAVVTVENLKALTKTTKFYDRLTQDVVSVAPYADEMWLSVVSSNKFKMILSIGNYNGWLRRRKLGATTKLKTVNTARKQCNLQTIRSKDLWPVTLEELDRVEFLEKIKGGSNVSKQKQSNSKPLLKRITTTRDS